MLGLLMKTPLLGLVLGPLVTLLGDYVHKAWAWLDNQSPIVKQAFAVVLSFVLVFIAQLVPGTVPDACANIAATGISSACQEALASGPFLQTVVAALTAIAVKHGKKTS